MRGLSDLVQDTIHINKHYVAGYNGRDYAEIIDFYKYSLRGLSNISLELLTNIKKNNCAYTISQQMTDFDKAHTELIGYFSSSWKGNKKYFDPSNMSPRIEIARGRPLQNIFKQTTINLLLDDQSIKTFYSSFLYSIGLDIDKSLNIFKKIWSKEDKIVDPRILAKSLNPIKQSSNKETKVCRHCWQIFNTNQSAQDEYLSHPCFLTIEERSNNIDYNLISINSPLFYNYLDEIAKDFSPSQKQAAILALDGSHNIWIYGAAGYGKSYITDWIIKYLTAKMGFDKILVCAMTKVSSKLLDGKTLHSIFKLGILTKHIYQYIHHRGEKLKTAVAQFIRIYFNDEEKIRPILCALVLVLDEVVQFIKDLHEFINELCKQIRNSDKYFGGLRVIYGGDTLQKKGGYIDQKLKDDLLKDFGIQWNNDADSFFFLSESFLKEGNFKIIVLEKHENFRYTCNEWFQFCSNCRVGKLTQSDFDYVNDDSKVGYGLTNDEKQLIRSYAFKVNKALIKSRLLDNKFSYSDQWRIDNTIITGVSKDRLQTVLNFKDTLNRADYLKNEKLLNETIFIATENKQISKYIEFQKSLTLTKREDTEDENNKIFECIAKDELYAVKKSDFLKNDPICIEGDLLKQRNKYTSIYSNYLDKPNIVNSEERLYFKKEQMGNVTMNSCGKFLAASQRFTIKSVEYDKSFNCSSIKIKPHESDNKYSNEIKLSRCSTDYPLSLSDVPYYLKNQKKYHNCDFYVKRTQFPISMTNSKTVQYVMGLTIPDGNLLFDVTWGINYTEGYTSITRNPSARGFIFLHKPRNLEELKSFFKPDPIALALDEYIMNECKSLGNCVIDVNFVFNKEKMIFEKSIEHNKLVNKQIDKVLNKMLK